ncbi:MAG: STAS domain-containing protein [Planctomycetota bacterium]
MQHDLVLKAEARSDGVVTIHISGVVDAHTLDRFEAALSKALDRSDTKSFVLDCNDLRYMNSAGFGELIRYHDRLRERAGTLVLARVPPKVAIILEMLGLKSLMHVVPSIEEGLIAAARGAAPSPEPNPEPAPEPTVSPASAPRVRVTPEAPVAASDRGVTSGGEDGQTVICAFCDTRVRVTGADRTRRWACPGCGAPFTVTQGGGVAFDWTNADAEAIHLTLDITPRTLAALAGLIEGILVERRVSHARMRRFAREAAHVCHVVSENAYAGVRQGSVHVLLLAGPQRLAMRIVDRGRSLGDDATRVFATQARLFLDFRYASLADGVNATEFAFAYTGSGVFVA